MEAMVLVRDDALDDNEDVEDEDKCLMTSFSSCFLVLLMNEIGLVFSEVMSDDDAFGVCSIFLLMPHPPVDKPPNAGNSSLSNLKSCLTTRVADLFAFWLLAEWR
jgi:hypothetical protein